MVGFMVDERPHVFLSDEGANRRFLEAIDSEYWAYQAAAHAGALWADAVEDRQRAAAALRVVYSQALETLFALIAAFVQSPKFPLAWLMRYTNRDLREVVRKIDQRVAFPCALRAHPSWDAVAHGVFQYLPEEARIELTERFTVLWGRFSREFLADYFEPEYNSLKHGMRAAVGGFAVAVGREDIPGVPAPRERMRTIGGSEYGSTFWMPPRKIEGFKFTFELSRNVTCGWAPQQFVSALPLIGMSISNVAGRALIAAGVHPTKVRFVWPSDPEAYESPWHEYRSIRHMSFGQTTDLQGWHEPSPEDLPKQAYGTPISEGGGGSDGSDDEEFTACS